MKESLDFLTQKTKKVFIELSEHEFLEKFTLVGGSGLAFYLNHRLSEDLDYFSPGKEINKDGLNSFIRLISKAHSVEIINEYNNGRDLLVDDVKITFFANDWDKLKNRNLVYKHSFAADIKILSIMKINALSLRAVFRDYYDLYVIANEAIPLNEILRLSLKEIPGMTKKIFAMQLIYTDDIGDESIAHLQPKHNISIDEIRKFFEKKLKNII